MKFKKINTFTHFDLYKKKSVMSGKPLQKNLFVLRLTKVVYYPCWGKFFCIFDQRLGAAHSIRWLKYAFLTFFRSQTMLGVQLFVQTVV